MGLFDAVNPVKHGDGGRDTIKGYLPSNWIYGEGDGNSDYDLADMAGNLPFADEVADVAVSAVDTITDILTPDTPDLVAFA